MSNEKNCNGDNECLNRYPTFKVPSCPPSPPIFPGGGNGAECSQCPSAVIGIFFDERNDPVSPPVFANLTLPPITVTAGQRVELNAFATLVLLSLPEVTEFGGNIAIILRRDGNPLTQAKDGPFAYSIPSVESESLFATPSLTWVDTPPPGIYVYSLLIVVDAKNMDPTNSFIEGRALTAKVYNAP